MAWGYKATITIDETKCGTADSTDFPLLVSGTYDGTGGEPDLRATGSGGKITDSSGYDIGFYSDSGLTTALKYERVSHNTTTGAVIYFVKVPTLSTSADTVIYMAYGDSGITTDQQDANNTWRSEFKAVWHMEAASGNESDTSGNSHTLTDANTVTSAAGKVGNAREFTAGNQEYFTSTNSTDWELGSGDFSVAYWVYAANKFTIFAIQRDGTSTYSPFFFGYTGLDSYGTDNGSAWNIVGGSYFSISNSTWTRCVISRIGNDFKFYSNASETGSVTDTGSFVANSNALAIGRAQTSNYATMLMDEMYFVKGLGFTASWVTADYNNQSSPSTFYTMGAESSTSAARGFITANSKFW